MADVATKVDLLERGAQDYLTKPFSLAELLARVRVRLRGEVIRAGQVTLDVARLVADVGGGPVHLTRLEFLLLRELAEHAGHAVSKGELLATVWGYDFDPGSNVVDVCVRRLRSKLGFDLIKTVRGEGYQLVARLRPRGGCPGLPRLPRFGWPYPPRAIDVGWWIFALVNLDFMFMFPCWETVPFHLIWASLTLVYGFRTWNRGPTLWVASAVLAVTAVGIAYDVAGRLRARHRADRGPAAGADVPGDGVARAPAAGGRPVAPRDQRAQREAARRPAAVPAGRRAPAAHADHDRARPRRAARRRGRGPASESPRTSMSSSAS